MNYRRAKTKGGTYFFTVITHERKRILCAEENVRVLRSAFKKVVEIHPFIVDAFILLPDHFHCIWNLPENDNDFSLRMRLIKSYFSRNCNDRNKRETSLSRKKKQEKGIWQRRFWEHLIRDESDYQAHLNYIHFNSVKHGYVSSPKEWKYSTFLRFVEKGFYDINWGTNEKIKFDSWVGNE